MGDSAPVQTAVAKFDNIDGIRVNSHGSFHDAMIVVEEEEAIGKFYGVCRRTGVERSSTTRDSFGVLDSWIDNPEQ